MQPIRIALVAAACACGALATGAAPRGERVQDRIGEALRREGDALVQLADDALADRGVRTDFALVWSHDFFKAQPGTFVPFTIAFSASDLASRRALLYVRVVDRSHKGRAKAGVPAYETIFPVRIEADANRTAYVTRGFAVPPGRYRVVAALRESPDESEDRGSKSSRKAGVLIQDLDVPDFWTGQLATSTIMLADRVEQLDAPVPADELDEDPYVVGSTRIHVSRTQSFARNGELIVAFLIYNPSIGADKQFDIQVDYHLYRKDQGGPPPHGQAGHPPARPGERYVTRTNPQRFNPSMMGPQFDPAAGAPVLAGQGILLSGFEPGAYRLGITVTDLLSGRMLSREVAFAVTGS
jgi:hypothetical protein